MTILEYLEAHSLRRRAFAAMLHISAGYLHDVLAGKKTPSVRMARRIEQATAGEVTAAEVLGVHQPQQSEDTAHVG